MIVRGFGEVLVGRVFKYRDATGARSVDMPRVRWLIRRAKLRGFGDQGSLAWVDANDNIVKHAFVVPLRERPEKKGIITCALLFLDGVNRCGWMRVAVDINDYRTLRKVSNEQLNLIALNLTVRGALLNSDSDTLAG